MGKQSLRGLLLFLFLSSVFLFNTTNLMAEQDENHSTGPSEENSYTSTSDHAQKLEINQQISAVSSSHDPLGYLTQTYYQNATNWNEAPKELLPFAERYQINNNFNGWKDQYDTGLLPINYMNSSIPASTSWFSNTSEPVSLPFSSASSLSFVPNFTVNITLTINDTLTSGDADLYVYNNVSALIASSTLAVGTDTVSFTPTDNNNHVIEIRNTNATTIANITLLVTQEVNETIYGMTPDYIPTRELVYLSNNIPEGTSLWSNETSDFPAILRFIPGFPVNITLTVNDNTTDGEADLFIYNSDGFVGVSTETKDTSDTVIFTPASSDIHVVEIRHPNDGIAQTNITLSIQQYANPLQFMLYMGDAATDAEDFNWYFTTDINSFGLVTPPNLDLFEVDAADSNNTACNILCPFNYGQFAQWGVSYVYNNASWTFGDLFFSTTSTLSSNFNLATVDEHNGFMSFFFSNGSLIDLGDKGVWSSSEAQNATLGANMQVLQFRVYWGDDKTGDLAGVSLFNDQDILIRSLDNDMIIEELDSNVSLVTVQVPGRDLASDNYYLEFNSSVGTIHQYWFTLDSTLFGNFFEPTFEIGYKETSDGKTLVFVQSSDIDTTIERVEFNYTLDSGVTWTPSRSMIWLEPHKYGFVIPTVASNIDNWTIGIYESAPNDQGKIRFQIISDFADNPLDLSVKQNTTLMVHLTPHGGNTAGNTTLKFGNIANYQLVPTSGSISTVGQQYVFDVTTSLTDNIEQIVEFLFIPKNPFPTGLDFDVDITSGSDQDLATITAVVVGPAIPTLIDDHFSSPDGSFVTMYPTLFNTYTITYQYQFTGGTPQDNFSVQIGSVQALIISETFEIDPTTVFPGIIYEENFTVTINDDITAIPNIHSLAFNIQFDGNSQFDADSLVTVENSAFKNLITLQLVSPPNLTAAGPNSIKVRIISTIDVVIPNLTLSIGSSGDYSTNINSVIITPLNPGENKTFTISYTFSSGFNFTQTTFNLGYLVSISEGKNSEYLFTVTTNFTPPPVITATTTTSTTTSATSPGFELFSVFGVMLSLLVIHRFRQYRND